MDLKNNPRREGGALSNPKKIKFNYWHKDMWGRRTQSSN